MGGPELILPGAGGGELTPLYVTQKGGGGLAAWTSGELGILTKFRVDAPRIANGLEIYNGAPSGNAKAGMYSSDGTTITQRALSAATALTGTNAKQRIPFASPWQLAPFQDYFTFLVLDNVTATLLRILGSNGAITTLLGDSCCLAGVYTTPPTTELVANFTSTSSGYYPVVAIY